MKPYSKNRVQAKSIEDKGNPGPQGTSEPCLFQIAPLSSIKSKIIIFALLATIIPSVSMGWLSYVQNRKFLSAKITQELKDITAQAAREVDLWLKERIYDIRVFSSSYLVSEDFEKIASRDFMRIENRVTLRRLKDYLRSVREKFIDYEELMLTDLEGNVVVTNADKVSSVKLPENWLAMAQTNKPIIGKAYWSEVYGTGIMIIAEPIRSPNDQILGLLAAKLNFKTIRMMLKNYTQGETGELYILTEDGIVLESSHPVSTKFVHTKLTKKIARRLFSQIKFPLNYEGYKEKMVVGALKRVPILDWGVIAEKEREKAYAQIVRLRNITLTLVGVVLLCISFCAYFLGLTIVRPLDCLTKGAGKVAAGDLDVDLPVRSRCEVGYLTGVFNHMVARLRKGREDLDAVNKRLREKNMELEEISVTDSLTALYNRKHLMETLDKEMARSRRYNSQLTLLIIDIDYFKKYNDTYGHLAGDEVLRQMSEIFRKSIRKCDYAARYGGEEFIIILPEIGQKDGVAMAERIRHTIVKEKIGGNSHPIQVTVSVGVALFPMHGDEPQSLISKADEALYQAKKNGRNQVVCAEEYARTEKQEIAH
ncbi:MAG: diguanylate cyclase [bacterium]